jgi:signal transduction histidine kinase/DNA-binding response OmpR family regulator
MRGMPFGRTTGWTRRLSEKLSVETSPNAGLRVLLVEDSRTDAELLVHHLRKSGLDFIHSRVETRDTIVRELLEFHPDIVLSDNRLPGLDAMTVIQISKELRPDIPIIVVTGTLDEESVVELVKAGAGDFVRKDRLGRLPLAVAKTLENAQYRRVRKDAEAKLRESEFILRLALTVTDQGVWRWDLGQETDRFQWDTHSSTLLGLRSDAPMNYAAWLDAIHPEDRADVDAELRRALDPANQFNDCARDFRVNRADSTIIWLSIAGRAVFEPGLAASSERKSVRILGTIRDVTRRKAIDLELELHHSQMERASEAAEQANHAKSRFLAAVTHELRTPLHGILGYAELLILEGGLTSAQSHRLQAMISAGQYLLRMINTVLDVSQIEAGQVELFPVEIELPALIRDCLVVIRPSAEAKGITLAPPPVAPIRLFADATRLQQVLINLLGNAVKFTPTGTVEVRMWQMGTEESVHLEVADTGPGIRAKHRDKLFQTFERLNAQAVSAIEGAGLGLALAAQLVHLMGGQIGYGDNPGGGSVFWVELPCGGVAGAEANAAATRAPVSTTHLRVLVADDDSMNRSIATGFLTGGGHEVVCVDGGAAAVEAAGTEHFDVILMDVRMPGMDGLEATRRIRVLPAPRGNVPVVALTAQAFTDQVEACRKAGMNTHISKPFTQVALLAAVAAIVSAKGSGTSDPISPAPAPFGASPGALVFDPAAFKNTTACLPSRDVGEHLRTLIGRAEAMLGDLHLPDTLGRARELAAAAHKLAGGAAMLGFLSLADVGRRFEHAANRDGVNADATQADSADTAVLAEQLGAAVEDAVMIMRQELAGVSSGAA